MYLSKQPAFTEIIFRRRVVTAPSKGITTEYSPRAEQNPYDCAMIIDTFHRVLRAGRTVHTGMAREMLLVKKDSFHAKNFKVWFKHLFP